MERMLKILKNKGKSVPQGGKNSWYGVVQTGHEQDSMNVRL